MSNIASAKVELTIEQLDAMRSELSVLKESNLLLKQNQKKVKLEFKLSETVYNYNHSRYNSYLQHFSWDTDDGRHIESERLVFHKIEYIECDDIKIVLREEEREKVKNEIISLNSRINSNDLKIISLTDKFDKKLVEVEKLHKEELEKKEEEKRLISNELNELKNKEVDRTKDEEIKQLKLVLERTNYELTQAKNKVRWSFWK